MVNGYWCGNRFTYQPVMPAVFDDSLSYLEIYAKICKKLNEIIDIMNRYDGVTEEWVKAYVEQQLADIKVLINNLNGDTNNRIDELKAYVNEQILILTDALNINRESIIEDAKLYTDKKFYELLHQFSDMIENGFLVYNPIKGYDTTVNEAVNDLYDALRVYSVTATEYDELNLTAEQYDNIGMTATEYDFFAKFFLWWWFSKNLISPLTGEYVNHQEAIDELANLHRSGGITAGEYDALKLTATAYDEKKITAYQYDFNAKNLLTNGAMAIKMSAERRVARANQKS